MSRDLTHTYHVDPDGNVPATVTFVPATVVIEPGQLDELDVTQ